MTKQMFPNEQWRPVAYVALQDVFARKQVVGALERAGWAVIPQPTGFHVLQSIAGVIEDDFAWLRPGLIVIDARSRGCTGTSIAAGLRELGIAIPIVLVAAPGEELPLSAGAMPRVADTASAEAVVAELARACAPGTGTIAAERAELRRAG